MQNFLINMCDKFHNDQLENDRALGNRKVLVVYFIQYLIILALWLDFANRMWIWVHRRISPLSTHLAWTCKARPIVSPSAGGVRLPRTGAANVVTCLSLNRCSHVFDVGYEQRWVRCTSVWWIIPHIHSADGDSLPDAIFCPPSLDSGTSNPTVHVSQKNPLGLPWGFVAIFPKRLEIFRLNFACLLCVHIYARLRNFVQ